MLSGVLAGDRRADRPVLSEREREVLIAWFECESKNLVANACTCRSRPSTPTSSGCG
jgi:hypothetical protein